LPSVLVYSVGMKTIQYTLRQIPSSVDHVLRNKARRASKSLNETAIEALARGAGVSGEPVHFHDLDELSGTWKEDPDFDKAIRAQDVIHPTLWK